MFKYNIYLWFHCFTQYYENKKKYDELIWRNPNHSIFRCAEYPDSRKNLKSDSDEQRSGAPGPAAHPTAPAGLTRDQKPAFTGKIGEHGQVERSPAPVPHHMLFFAVLMNRNIA
jgi:hypothetical protein